MKLRKKLCIVLSAAVLMQLLAGCRPTDPAEASCGPDATERPSQSQRGDVPDSSAEPPAEPTPEPTPDPWDPEHRLDFQFTPAKGLELPVTGATGYASVKLPLWEELPREEEGKLATIYAPAEPEPEPGPTDEMLPEAPPAESLPEPVPEPLPEPVQPLPESAGELAAPQADAPAPGEGEGEEPPAESMGGEPAPAEENSGEPAVEPTEEPAVELTPEPTLEPALEPAPEPTPAPDPMEGALLALEPGTAFMILSESGDWWQVRTQNVTGWVEHRYCLINLPDVIPSMIYNDTNAYSSLFVSGGKSIPNITGKALYEAREENPRLGRREFMMPVLYSMAKNVCQAQQNALAEGNTLVLYEGFRPYDAQTAVARNLRDLSRKDERVKAGISTAPWSMTWFIATGISNHQRGYAMDVSLAKVTKAHMGRIGGHSVVQVDGYEEYAMPTAMHELSMAAATFTQPVAPHSDTAWRSARLAPAMAENKPAMALQRYCTEAKLTPLSSEWWHFNDLNSMARTRDYPSGGAYRIRGCLSEAPW